MPSDDQTLLNTPNRRFQPAPRPRLNLSLRSPCGHAPVRVACHRGDWRNYVENTLEAVESCIGMGADIVEVDVWRTKDGHLILMHDETLDRTSDGHGRVADHTLQEIRALHLKDGLGNMTEYTIPTAEEVLRLAKDRVVINLDKAEPYLDEVYELLLKMDMVGQTILKSELPYEKLRAKWGSLLDCVVFMPILNITADTTTEQICAAFAWQSELYEVNFAVEDAEKMALLRKLAAEQEATLWINTIWPSTCGGYSDDRALKNKDANWGYVLAKLGAGVLQTDRPATLLSYLSDRGWR